MPRRAINQSSPLRNRSASKIQSLSHIRAEFSAVRNFLNDLCKYDFCK
ncbi:hypothetical protein GCWU000342_00657 [Shuttleworthella satelles DSM 14600]|uniref:Uncharacterized protein n=1 Tax=Shuttleworthella satelles DSM 14600 TaxID=626523 RepID=C4G9K4_9FIRM|nr:hypothetical protein GCWU000342_00657 [Shuttleworthia satelles DSM 14600]